MYADIWLNMKSAETAPVHATSRFKSKREQQNHENTKTINKQKRDRQREQREFERFADLNRVIMDEVECRSNVSSPSF